MTTTTTPCPYCEQIKKYFSDYELPNMDSFLHGNMSAKQLIKYCKEHPDGYSRYSRFNTLMKFAHGHDVQYNEIILLLYTCVINSMSTKQYTLTFLKFACTHGDIAKANEIIEISQLFDTITREEAIQCAAECQNAALMKEFANTLPHEEKHNTGSNLITIAIEHDKASLLSDLRKIIDFEIDFIDGARLAAKCGNIISASYFFGHAASATATPNITEIIQVAIDNSQYDFAYKFIKQFEIPLQNLKFTKDAKIDAFIHRLL